MEQALAMHDRCPRCSSDTVAVEDSTVPWCPACEYGLDSYDPTAAPWRGSRWLSRWGYRRGFVLDEAVRAEIIANPESASRRSGAETALVVISVMICVVSLACLVGAMLVWFRDDWLPPVKFFVSLGLLLLAIWLRPRFGRMPKDGKQIPEGQALALRGLVGSVASAIGAPEPDVIVLDALELNLSVQRVGIRGRTVLTIGIPMWLLLTPPQRIAVLGHELGHLINRDPARRTLTMPALRIFQSAVEWSGGHSPWRRMGDRMFDEKQQSVFALVGMFVIALANSLFGTIQLAIEAIVMPDHRRAEYAADLLGREVAGTQAALEVEDRFVMMDHHVSGMKADAVSCPPTDWAQLATLRDRGYAADLPMLRQASRRETDLWSSHPPSGSRAVLLAALPHVEGSVAVDLDQFALIDSELAGWYAALHREILGADEFLG